jgi:hypothetical protein
VKITPTGDIGSGSMNGEKYVSAEPGFEHDASPAAIMITARRNPTLKNVLILI